MDIGNVCYECLLAEHCSDEKLGRSVPCDFKNGFKCIYKDVGKVICTHYFYLTENCEAIAQIIE